MIEKLDLARQMADMKDSDHWLRVGVMMAQIPRQVMVNVIPSI